MIMDKNQEQSNNEEVNSNKNNHAVQGEQPESNENDGVDYSNLDIDESTGGSAMEDQENENSRDMDEDEI